MDEQTKVAGKLAVGAQANVEYPSNAGKNIAIHVVAVPGSGMSLH